MKFSELNERINKISNPKIQKKCIFFNALAGELEVREIPDEVLGSINTHLEEINSYEGSDKGLLKTIRKEQTAILRLVEK